VHTGQCLRLPAPYPLPFGSSGSASCAGFMSRWLHTPSLALPIDACETGYPVKATRRRRLSPLQTLEDQSQVWGICCHSCTWREGLAPSWSTELQGSSSPCGLPGSQGFLSTNGSHGGLISVGRHLPDEQRRESAHRLRFLLGKLFICLHDLRQSAAPLRAPQELSDFCALGCPRQVVNVDLKHKAEVPKVFHVQRLA